MAFDKEQYRANREAGRRGQADPIPRENAYVCPDCKQPTITVDVDEGVTPMFISCKATEGCEGMAQSMMYPKAPRPSHVPAPAWEWYKPTRDEVEESEKEYPGSIQHWDNGGLFLRERTDRQPVYHKLEYVK